MAVVLAVATFTVHLPNGFSSIKLLSVDAAGAHFGPPGYETDLLYFAGLVAGARRTGALGSGSFAVSQNELAGPAYLVENVDTIRI
jgi:putative oxidoreductase